MIEEILSNEKHDPVVTELFIYFGKLNISLAFITELYFAVAKKRQIKLYTLLCHEDFKKK